jgi:glycosyltransferase involved in cell wall biosynthesis
MSGGNRIFIECAKRWLDKGIAINVFTSDVGEKLCRDNGLNKADYVTWVSSKFRRLGAVILYLIGTVKGCFIALKKTSRENKTVIYSSSDFWPDSLPAFMMKRKLKNSKWVAGFYLFAPNPFKSSSDVEYRGGRMPFSFKTLSYYISQRIVYWLINRYVDFILVANELDRGIFIKDGISPAKVKPVYGGVDIKVVSKILPQKLKYDGCFVGRLHPQKGPLELIKIWDLVCKTRPKAKLALIGDGPLKVNVRNEIRKRSLEQNVDMLGTLDGEEKYKILKSSKVFLHTPILDTGGMAAAEGMACGLPVVGFDLPGYQFCYPRGMLKAPVGDIEAFANLVLNLLRDEDLYNQVKKEALIFAQEWDWDKKAQDILSRIENLFD